MSEKPDERRGAGRQTSACAACVSWAGLWRSAPTKNCIKVHRRLSCLVRELQSSTERGTCLALVPSDALRTCADRRRTGSPPSLLQVGYFKTSKTQPLYFCWLLEAQPAERSCLCLRNLTTARTLASGIARREFFETSHGLHERIWVDG